jgi:hypothetical protein
MTESGLELVAIADVAEFSLAREGPKELGINVR